MRAQIEHFCCFGFFRRIDLGHPQMFEQRVLPLQQRQWNRSLIVNDTSGVDIYVYTLRIAQAKTVMRTQASISSGGLGADASVGLSLSRIRELLPAGLAPQCTIIPSGNSQWFHIPKCGCFRRKACVIIVTATPQEIRTEAILELPCHRLLTVRMRAAGGRVLGRPAANGGLLASLVTRTHEANFSPTTTDEITPSSEQQNVLAPARSASAPVSSAL